MLTPKNRSMRGVFFAETDKRLKVSYFFATNFLRSNHQPRPQGTRSSHTWAKYPGLEQWSITQILGKSNNVN